MISTSNNTQDQGQIGSRSEAFSMGITGGGPRATSLEAAQTKFKMQTPDSFTPSSVLDMYQQPGFHPANGSSDFDASRQTPNGPIPTANGQSLDNWQKINPSTYRTRMALK